MQIQIHRSDSLDETRKFGHDFARTLIPGTVVGLSGPLGAGKTTLVRSIAEGLGCANAFVNSPTFVVIQEYEGRIPVFHVDAYRLRDSDEFLEMGGDELLSGNGVCLIEWAERIADVLPGNRVLLNIIPVGLESREFHVTRDDR